MNGPILEVQDISRTFVSRHGGRTLQHRAVNSVAFQVEAGGCLAIVGESGSGKTTTARIIAGLEVADSGRVLIDGAEMTTGRRKRRGPRDVQMVFQDPFGSLDPRQRVGQAIDELLKLQSTLSRTERRARVLELLDQVGLDERYVSELPRNLSGGQRQRVAIAKALAASPRVLILDEAVSALDVSVQAQVLNLLIDLRRDTGITYVFVSHDLAVVRQISDTCIVMSKGRIVEMGDTAKVLLEPEDAYTRELVNAIPRPGWVPKRRV